MTREEAIKKIWDMVTNDDVIKEAEKLAREYDVFMEFCDDYIAVEDDIFYF